MLSTPWRPLEFPAALPDHGPSTLPHAALLKEPMDPSLILVVAAANNGVIGGDNRLLWRLKTDLRRFRDLTWGKPMIMGRKTFESIGKPLPGRETIVLTRDRAFALEGIRVAHSWDEAVAQATESAARMGATEIAVVGGAEIYRLALPQCSENFPHTGGCLAGRRRDFCRSGSHGVSRSAAGESPERAG